MNDLDRAYLAGLFDGEGYVGIIKHNHPSRNHTEYTLRISITNSDQSLLSYLKSTYGGYITIKSATNSRYASGEWRLSSNQAKDFLKELLPYFRIKGRQAEVAIHFQETRPGAGRNQHTPVTPEEVAIRDAYIEELKRLKKEGYQYGSQTDH